MKRILIINSSLSVFRKLAPIASDNRFSFVFAKTGNEGLGLFKKNHIDIVISHLINSDIDDIELMFNIHEIKPEVPVIVIIPRNSRVKKSQFIEAGAFDCIDEQAAEIELANHINQAIQKVQQYN